MNKSLKIVVIIIGIILTISVISWFLYFSIAWLFSMLYSNENRIAADLVKSSEEIKVFIDKIDELRYIGRPTKTETDGLITKFYLISYDGIKHKRGIRYEVEVRIEKDGHGEWFIYSWEIIREESYQG